MCPVGVLPGFSGALQELLTGTHGKHQGTDAFQFVTGEQPADSAYSLQSIWEVGETRSPQRGALLGIPRGTMAIGALFSVDGTVSVGISLGEPRWEI